MAYTIMMMMLIMITMIIMRDRAARWPSRESGRGDPTDGPPSPCGIIIMIMTIMEMMMKMNIIMIIIIY